MKAVQSGKKRVRSVSLDACGVTKNRSIDTTSDEETPQGISTLLNAADKLAVSKLLDITNQHPSRQISASNEVTPGISFLLDAATSVSPSKKPRQANQAATEISDDEEITRQTKRPTLSNIPAIAPSAEELAEATTFRSRSALSNWYERLRELYEYKEIHNDCLVPQKYPPNPALGIWVNKQRMEKKLLDQGLKSSMTKHRLEKLDQAGFHWAKQKGDVSWENKYAELCQFHEKHGHCLVPTKYTENSALGRWISTQRAQAKVWLRGGKSNMTKERYEKLCALNFQFDRLCSKEKGENPTFEV